MEWVSDDWGQKGLGLSRRRAFLTYTSQWLTGVRPPFPLPAGRQLFADAGLVAPTPIAAGALHRQMSAGDGLLAAASAYAFQPGSIWGPPTTGPASALPQLQPGALQHSGLPPLQQHGGALSTGALPQLPIASGDYWDQLRVQQDLF